jgi:Rne/Rng family ribonuclease
MSKEIYISSTPHETRLAMVEDDRLAEIYYERENEYTLAGSVYKGRVTRVLPGMQSAFVDIGLERDAFLYITDFLEETEDSEDLITLPQSQPQQRSRSTQEAPEATSNAPAAGGDEESAASSGDQDRGTRRWRGRRGRRGRGNNRNERSPQQEASAPPSHAGTTDELAPDFDDTEDMPAPEAQTDLQASAQAANEPAATEAQPQRPERFRDRLRNRFRGRNSGRGRENRNDADASQTHSGPERSFEPERNVEPARSVEPAREFHRADAPAPAATPFILPGESLSKYRRADAPAPVQASAQTQDSAPAAASAARPSPSAPTSRPSTLIEAPLPWDGGILLPGESRARQRTAAPAPAATPAPPAAMEPIAASAPAITPEPPAATPVVETEYAPEQASASYRVDPATPSAYRQGSTPEAVLELETMEAPAAAPANESFHTNAADLYAVEAPMETEPASSVEEAAAPLDPHAFVPGSGLLEEELIDEEETEFAAAGEPLEELEFDDLIEETLDEQMDPGLLSEVVRDVRVEEHTRFREPASGEETEQDEEEDLETVEFSGGFEDADETDAELTDEELGEDASSEEAEEEDAIAADPAQAARSNPARPGRRDRNGRTGRGRRMGGGRGRRATAQTTNLPAITELLKSGQEILVQIAKEPIARKGARITSHIALPGRFIVFMPTVNHVGVSRKIASDEERQRLKRILISEKGDVHGGFIVRTAAAAASEEELRADIRFLLNLWADIRQRAEGSKPPALIYHDLSLVERILRDQVNENFSAIWVDSEADYERVLRFLQRFQPSLIRRVKLYTKQTPLFEQFGVQEEINKALRSKVWLKSGGSIVINQTEALVAIDINTGKYVGKTARLEDTILKTNLDAIPEIVRQIRLRDLGGIIVIDFIDMDERKNRHRVMQALEEELKSDRAPSKVLQFNDFGLVAITRKRVKQSLERTLSTQCNVCTGTGMVKSPVTVCNEIYVEMRKMHRSLERQDILLRVHPDVVKQLKSNGATWLTEMEEMTGKTILVKSDPSLHPEQFDIH